MAHTTYNPHPGEILQEEFLTPLGLSQNKLAHYIGVPSNRINMIVNGKRDISADTDLRLCKFFALSEGFFQRLQIEYHSWQAQQHLENVLPTIPAYHNIVK